MEKKGSGLMSTLTNTAVRVKSSRMTSRLPRIRTVSEMLLRTEEGSVGIAGPRPGEGRGQESHPRAGQWGLGRDAGGRGGSMEGLPWAQMELPQQRQGRDNRGMAWH